MGSAGTDGMTGLFQVSLGEVKVAGERWEAEIPYLRHMLLLFTLRLFVAAFLIRSFSRPGLVLIASCPLFGRLTNSISPGISGAPILSKVNLSPFPREAHRS